MPNISGDEQAGIFDAAGIFDGPQIRTLIRDKNFTSSMNSVELSAWNAFVLIVKKFLGNTKADNNNVLVKKLLKSFKKLKDNMSIKVHYLFSHLERFSENLGNFS